MEITSYGKVPGRSVLSRVCLRMDGYILHWPSIVLSWLQIGRYVADTIRQLPLTADPSLSRNDQYVCSGFIAVFVVMYNTQESRKKQDQSGYKPAVMMDSFFILRLCFRVNIL
jgi:hypothetical protein